MNYKFKVDIVYFWILLILQFPWLSFSTNSFDTQPWLLLSFFIYILLIKKRISINHYRLIILLLFLILFLLILNYSFHFDVVRKIVSLLILFSSFSIFIKIQEENYDINKPIIFGNLLYLIIAFIQFLSNPYVFNFIVNVRTSDLRGVTSLTPEPTFFGLVLLLYVVYYILKIHKKRKEKIFFILIVINILFIIFISKSFTALLGLMSFFGLYSLFKSKNLWYFFTKTIAFFSIVLIILFVLKSYNFGRISNISDRIISNPYELVRTDESVSIRLQHILTPFLINFDNFLLPINELDISEKRNNVINKYFNDIFLFIVETNKTNSYIGAYLLSLGFIFYLIVSYFLIKSFHNKTLSVFLSFLSILLLSIPPSMPFVGFILAMLIYKDKFNENMRLYDK